MKITDAISIEESDVVFDYIRASGPGGQNVNKVSTAVQLRFDVVNSKSLPDEVKTRLIEQAKNRINKDGILIIDARTSRSQDANRQMALDRLAALIRRAAITDPPRRPTSPSAAARSRRLRKKRLHSEKKQLRGKIKDW